MTEPLSPETLERLNHSVAEEVARAKPQFAKLAKYRDFIQSQMELGTPQRAMLRTLEKEEGLRVSPDTLSRYVRESGFRRAKTTRRKKKPAVAIV